MVRIGIVCPSDIAIRRFLPALKKIKDFEFVGVAIADKTEWINASDEILNFEKIKAENLIENYGGKLFNSYKSLISSSEVDGIYIPLPPALHYKWAKLALLEGKHVLVEKPATINLSDTINLINIAIEKKRALHENYMFAFHEQVNVVKNYVESKRIGIIKLVRLTFGFPRRSPNDFRYNKVLGGGALLDCGGYTLKFASMLLGETAKLLYATSGYIDDFEVDVNGSAAIINDDGLVAQVAFGMDHSYKCDIEIWGSNGVLTSDRIFTAPPDFTPEFKIVTNGNLEVIKVESEDTFLKSLKHFKTCIEDERSRTDNYSEIIRQANLVNDFFQKANNI